MPNLSAGELLALSTNIAALVLAVIAIWLSIVFFKMSSSLSESTKEAAKGISESVDRLENLFDKLYSDTFSMMRDTVSDMRRHIWPEDKESLAEETEKRSEEKLGKLREDISSELSSLLNRQMKQDERLDKVRKLVDHAIVSTKEMASEAREETLRARIRHAVKGKEFVTLLELCDEIPVSRAMLANELSEMKEDGLVYWPRKLALGTPIQVNPTIS